MLRSEALSVRTPWAEIEPVLRDRAYRHIDAMPEILLETDSWFTLDADLIYARLIGYEDEIVKDGLRLPRVEPEIYLAIMRRPRIYEPTPAEFSIEPEPMLKATYRLQSCYTTLDVSAELYDVPVENLRHDHIAKVAYLRYRRRS